MHCAVCTKAVVNFRGKASQQSKWNIAIDSEGFITSHLYTYTIKPHLHSLKRQSISTNRHKAIFSLVTYLTVNDFTWAFR